VDWLTKLRNIADYWFGKGAGEKLLPDDVKIIFGNTGRPRQVWLGDRRLFSIRSEDFYYILAWGALRIQNYLKKVEIKSDVSLKNRGSVLRGDIVKVEDDIIPGENVLVVQKDKPVAVGIAKLSSYEMKTSRYGEMIRIKEKFI